ncbi:MAG: WecB/TagA/CpsF family glycosyltransferase [Bacteroidetes bacterium]|nr:WecB/TagA/CpsF family glycosyltransferase [Bacteroidota bacterium]
MIEREELVEIQLKVLDCEGLVEKICEVISSKQIINIIPSDYRVLNYLYYNKLEIFNSPNTIAYPDSSLVFITAKLFGLGKYLSKRIVSTDFHLELLASANKENRKMFLLGDTNSTLKTFCCKLSAEYPNIKIVGNLNGYSDLSREDIYQTINESFADILMIGLGVPLQEEWLNKSNHELDTPVRITCGAFLSFYSGQIKRAPLLFRLLWMEWLFRFIHEPTRLFRRYFIESLIFLSHHFKVKYGKRKAWYTITRY